MFKKFIYIALILMTISSCEKFLDVTPKNVLSMHDLTTIRRSLGSYLYGVGGPGRGYGQGGYYSVFSISTTYVCNYSDDWDLSKWSTQQLTEEEMNQLDWKSTMSSNLWVEYYKTIGLMNVILYEAESQKERNDDYNYVTGEALLHRAYCFFKLVQFFSPYDNNALGLPICLNTQDGYMQADLERKTQKEVYAQILKDIDAASERIKITPASKDYNFLYDSKIINRLKAQVFLYKAGSAAKEDSDWANAAKYAGFENQGITLVSDPNRLKNLFNFINPYIFGRAIDLIGIETPIAKVYYFPQITSVIGYSRGKRLNLNLYNSFSSEDIRSKFYFSGNNADNTRLCKSEWYYAGWDIFGSGCLLTLFRQAEMFLIEAEALAQSGKLQDAKNVFLRFKQARYTGNIVIPSSKEDLLLDIYNERQKELLSEHDYRWLDMKRLGIGLTRSIGGNTYTLKPDDYRFSFRIPDSEISGNKFMPDNNPGWL